MILDKKLYSLLCRVCAFLCVAIVESVLDFFAVSSGFSRLTLSKENGRKRHICRHCDFIYLLI